MSPERHRRRLVLKTYAAVFGCFSLPYAGLVLSPVSVAQRWAPEILMGAVVAALGCLALGRSRARRTEHEPQPNSPAADSPNAKLSTYCGIAIAAAASYGALRRVHQPSFSRVEAVAWLALGFIGGVLYLTGRYQLGLNERSGNPRNDEL